jgi:hypothetical protein
MIAHDSFTDYTQRPKSHIIEKYVDGQKAKQPRQERQNQLQLTMY